MNDLNLLLRAVIEHPDEDTPRLMYADELEARNDRGDALVAEFIRVQIGCSKWSEEEAVNNIDVDWATKGKRERTLLSHLQNEMRDRIPSSQPDCHSWSFYLHRHEDETPDEYTASFDRGFLRTVVCRAGWFLRHADELIWHREQTIPSPKCETCGGVKSDERGVWKDKHGHDYWIRCHVCKGKDRVPRPCPPTAQPIRRVVLTTYPVFEEWVRNQHGVTYQFTGRKRKRLTRAEDDRSHRDGWSPLQEMLSREWPGVEFVLPRTDNVDAARQLYEMGVPLSHETLYGAAGLTPPGEE